VTIEITNPEDEQIIRTKLQNGEFRSIDELIHNALVSPPTPAQPKLPRLAGKKSLAQLFAESPFRGLDIEFERLPGMLRSTKL
jgi:hypothetical protein